MKVDVVVMYCSVYTFQCLAYDVVDAACCRRQPWRTGSPADRKKEEDVLFMSFFFLKMVCLMRLVAGANPGNPAPPLTGNK
jgi:hypothetical protein